MPFEETVTTAILSVDFAPEEASCSVVSIEWVSGEIQNEQSNRCTALVPRGRLSTLISCKTLAMTVACPSDHSRPGPAAITCWRVPVTACHSPACRRVATGRSWPCGSASFSPSTPTGSARIGYRPGCRLRQEQPAAVRTGRSGRRPGTDHGTHGASQRRNNHPRLILPIRASHRRSAAQRDRLGATVIRPSRRSHCRGS
jgi:hypothetical protein